MPRIKLTKSAIDALPIRVTDVVYWDTGCPGFGVKVTPRGRKVFLVLYRTGGSGSKLRKFTIGPYGRVFTKRAFRHKGCFQPSLKAATQPAKSVRRGSVR